MDQNNNNNQINNLTEPEGRRKEFLLAMYNQMWNNINTHLLVVWQSIGTLIASFAIYALTEKNVISLDIATTLIILISSWLIAHIYDSSNWYNRNLLILSNIERQFLTVDDLTLIHYYFARHRKQNKMILHLRIQYFLGIANIIIVVLFHIIKQILPPNLINIINTIKTSPTILIPYIALIACAFGIKYIRKRTINEYEELFENSPGKLIPQQDLDRLHIKFNKGQHTVS